MSRPLAPFALGSVKARAADYRRGVGFFCGLATGSPLSLAIRSRSWAARSNSRFCRRRQHLRLQLLQVLLRDVVLRVLAGRRLGAILWAADLLLDRRA